MIRAITCADLVTSGEQPRDADRVFVRLGAAVGEEESVDIARRDLRQFCAQPRANVGGHKRVCIRQRLGLLLDRIDHAFIAVTDVHAHQLAVEIDEALAVRRIEIDAFRARDRNRIDSGLHGPFKERVLATEFDDLFARQLFSCGAHRPRMLFQIASVDKRQLEAMLCVVFT